MKEIKTTTVYSEKLVKKFLKDFYFERIKYVRILINVLILAVIIYFFTKDEITTIDIITLGCSLFGIIEVNSSLLPRFNYFKLAKRKNNILDTKIKYIFKEHNFKLSSGKDEYINYKDLKKVIEVYEAYYLYINNSRALILSKESLKDDEIFTLTSLFKEKVPTYKYKK